MSESNTSNVTGHRYDDIEEYDNPLPGWWSWIFAVSIVFSVVYFFFTTLIGAQASPEGFYDREVTADMERQFAMMGDIKSDAASLLKLTGDEKLLKVGRSIFVTNCAACHNANGSGLTGPNLTDDVYVHVKRIEDVADVVTVGRNNGAMPAWGNRLQPKEVTLVAAYVASLRGTNVAGRAPEGQAIAPWAAAGTAAAPVAAPAAPAAPEK
jgi:cytochrome c oxidase cbb3-type subunit 3